MADCPLYKVTVPSALKMPGVIHNAGDVIPRIDTLIAVAAVFDFGRYPRYAREKLGLIVEGSHHNMAPLAALRVIAKVMHDEAGDRVVRRVNLGH